jgi:branched-chain amino acid transport system substrate-binding protein
LFSNEAIVGDVVKNLGPLIEGVLFAEAAFDENNPQTKVLLDKYTQKYGSLGVVPPIFLATSYDAVYILKEMVDKYGDDIEKIKAGLYLIKNRQGAAGMLTIDANGDAILEYAVKTVKGGKVVPYED